MQTRISQSYRHRIHQVGQNDPWDSRQEATLCPSATIGSQAERGPPTAPLPGLYSGFLSPGPTTLELGPPQFGPVVHISHRSPSDSRMNIEAHEHNPQLPAEGSGQRLLLGTLHVCSRTSPPRKVLGERRRNGVTGRLGLSRRGRLSHPRRFIFELACWGGRCNYPMPRLPVARSCRQHRRKHSS